MLKDIQTRNPNKTNKDLQDNQKNTRMKQKEKYNRREYKHRKQMIKQIPLKMDNYKLYNLFLVFKDESNNYKYNQVQLLNESPIKPINTLILCQFYLFQLIQSYKLFIKQNIQSFINIYNLLDNLSILCTLLILILINSTFTFLILFINLLTSTHQFMSKNPLTKQSTISTKPSQKLINKGFQKQFIYDVLTQQEHCRKHKNKQTLTKLIQLYRKLVEFYSERNDNIQYYFQQKISQASMQIATLQQPDQRLTMSMARQVMEEQQNNIDPRFKTVITTPIRYDPQIKKKQRSKNAQIAIEINKIKKRANARTILKSYYDECLENNILINQDLQNQRKLLQQKLMAIHQRSMNSGNTKVIL